VLVGQLHDGTSRTMALVIAAAATLGLLTFIVGLRRTAASPAVECPATDG